MEKVPVVYYAFDLLYCDGHDLRGVPLLERKNLLAQILRRRFARALLRPRDRARARSCTSWPRRKHLEGIIGKEIHGRYPEGRTRSWLKFKLGRDLDAVVGGWTDPRKSREHFGALLAGLYEGGEIEIRGQRGNRIFTFRVQAALAKQLAALATKKCPFDEAASDGDEGALGEAGAGDARGLRELDRRPQPASAAFPRLGAGSQTGRVHVREGNDSCDGRRTMIRREPEAPRQNAQASRRKPAQKRDGQRRRRRGTCRGTEERIARAIGGGNRRESRCSLTNLNKVYFPGDGYTKRDLLHYYLTISPFLLPFLKDRPLVLRRYPNGIASKAFFQKDAGKKIPGVDRDRGDRIREQARDDPLLSCNDLPTLLYLTNLGCIDHNPWSSRADDQEHPDYIFFDLDPSDDTPFADVIALAKDLVTKLESLRLKVYIKTSGATGIHIYIPIHPHYTFEQVRKFVEVVAGWAARDNPGRITSERTVSKRPKRSIYIDAHQNSRGQSLASVYSVRAFPHAPVSTPISRKRADRKAAPGFLDAEVDSRSGSKKSATCGPISGKIARTSKQRSRISPRSCSSRALDVSLALRIQNAGVGRELAPAHRCGSAVPAPQSAGDRARARDSPPIPRRRPRGPAPPCKQLGTTLPWPVCCLPTVASTTMMRP